MEAHMQTIAAGVQTLLERHQDAASNLPDIKQASGLQLVIGLLVATVLFTGITSMGRSSVDLNTSDGTNLEFGQRQERNYDPYKPQYGSQ